MGGEAEVMPHRFCGWALAFVTSSGKKLHQILAEGPKLAWALYVERVGLLFWKTSSAAADEFAGALAEEMKARASLQSVRVTRLADIRLFDEVALDPEGLAGTA